MRARLAGILLGTLVLSTAAAACSSKERVRGQLIIAIQTDIPLPQEVDSVIVQVLSESGTLFSNLYQVPGEQKIPATLAIVSDDTARPLRIRVIGKRGNTVRTLRETVTTVPKDRVVTLRMPIQWLCDATTVADPTTIEGATSKCPANQTCRAGACVDATTPSQDLPDYKPEEIFGGGDEKGVAGTCYDTVPCMLQGSLVTPTLPACTIQAVVTPNTNLAMRVPQGGICDVTETSCFVPLDRDDGPDGWKDAGNGLIQLPTEICARLEAGRVSGVVLSSTCLTKTAAQPTCGPWSSVQEPSTPIEPPGASSVPVLAGTITTSLGGEDRAICCPLLQNGQNQFLTCACRPGSAAMELAFVDPVSSAITRAGTVTLLSKYGSGDTFSLQGVAAGSFGGELYFLDRDPTKDGQGVVRRANPSDGVATEVGRITNVTYDDATLLIDAASIYTLVSTTAVGSTPAEFRLLKMNRLNGTTETFPTGPRAVTQFAQDGDSLYVATLSNTGAAPQVTRSSKLLRISKTNGASTILAESTSTTNDPDGRGGFYGVRAFGDAVYAVEEGDVGPGPELAYDSTLIRVPIAGGEKTTLLKQRLSATRAENRTLGIARTSLVTLQRDNDGTRLRSSVALLPLAGGAGRIVADFKDDSPLVGPSLLVDEPQTNMFFLNRSGRLFKLAIQ